MFLKNLMIFLPLAIQLSMNLQTHLIVNLGVDRAENRPRKCLKVGTSLQVAVYPHSRLRRLHSSRKALLNFYEKPKDTDPESPTMLKCLQVLYGKALTDTLNNDHAFLFFLIYFAAQDTVN